MEIYRLRYNKKILLLMLILLVLNGVCFLQQQFRQNSYREIKEETSIRLQLMREVRNLDAAETEKYLSGILNGDYSETYKNSCLELLAQMEHITTYDEYIEQVIEESGRVSRFSVFATDSSDFSTQNAANVVSEYEGLEGVKLLPGNDKPVVQFMDYQLMIYLSVVMTIVIAFMVIREHDAGITQLIYSSARGRLPLGFKRCGFISLAAFVCTALNMLTVWLLSLYLYGGGIGRGRSIQSIGMFADVTEQVSIAGFLLQYYLLAALSVAVIGVFVWMVMNLIPNTILSLLIAISFYIFEYQCTRSITLQSNWRFLKYANIVEYLNIEEYFFKYYDFNCFGRAVPLSLFVIAGMIILFFAFAIVGISTFVVRPTGTRRWKRVKLPGAFYRLQEHYSLPAAELRKMLICNKGILVILVLIVAVSGIMKERNFVYTDVEQYVNAFYDRYEGPLKDEVYQYIESESQYIEDTYEEYEKTYQAYQDGEIDKFALYRAEAELKQAKIAEEGLQKIGKEIERAEELDRERDIQISLMNHTGYDMLLGTVGKATQRNIIVLCLLGMVLMFSGNLRYEENSKITGLLRSTAKGRRELLHAKEMAAFAVMVLIACISYGVQIYCTAGQYGLPDVTAPVQSIAILHSFPLKFSILTYMAGVFIIRCVLYILITDLLLHLSVLVDQKIIIAAFLAIVVIPVMTGQSVAAIDKVSCYDLLNLNEIILGETNLLLAFVKLTFLLVIVIVVKGIAVRKWCGGKTYDS